MKIYNFSKTLTHLMFINFSENKNFRVKIRTKSNPKNRDKDEWRFMGVVQAPSSAVAKENALYKFGHQKVTEFKPSRATGGAVKGALGGAVSSVGSSLISSAVEGVLDRKKVPFKDSMKRSLRTTGIGAAVGATMGGISGLMDAFSRPLNSSDIKVEEVN